MPQKLKYPPACTAESLEKARDKLYKKQGRPTRYNDNIAIDILVKMEEGLTLTAICKLPGMPGHSTVYRWGDGIPAFRDALAHARRLQGNALAHEGLEILDGVRAADKNMVEARLAEMRAKYRLELAKCYDRATYGDKVQVDQQVTVESMADRIKRLTGQIVTIPAEFMHIVE